MAPLFETGKTYTFYFGQEHGHTNITGQVISYESPLVKIETGGLTRIINCSSSYFVEAVARLEGDETGDEPKPSEEV
ncbi:MAG: hypothetical protein OEU80_04640 [Deltaproteobacteria bacterium]|jgi:hypothetical protein|nr:hypothetical protein [Deltaproteobacteria bacterium]MDH3772838.1 hypothetical protein [Deltaproteobacteria bacterium]MDH3801354.1 hypothetical protein [Deltaproteobacteria bacterium]MDH3849608.1 hypothetical protein [Deltaproteobacteria bacterium]MDH3929160.1 hypothetical protein [Deltaproteobacteria bacterium]